MSAPCSVHWEGTLLSHLLFSLIKNPKFDWKDKSFVNFLCPPFSGSNSGPLYCPSGYAVTLFLVLSKGFNEDLLIYVNRGKCSNPAHFPTPNLKKNLP